MTLAMTAQPFIQFITVHRRKVFILVILFSVVFVAIVSAFNDNELQPTSSQTISKPALTVTLTTMREREWPERLHASGNILPWQLVSIGAEITGIRITEVNAKVGDSVKKGQILAHLDDSLINVELNLQRANLTEAEANLAQAKLSLERAKKLEVSRAISLQDLLQYETSAKTSAAKVDIARAQVKALELRQRFTKIVAADDGVIAASNASVGALSESVGDLFKLIRKGRIEWRAELRPEQQAKVVIGQSVEIKDPLGAIVRGTVRQIAPTADLDSRMSLVYVDVDPSKTLKPGVLVTGDFLVGRRLVSVISQSALVVRDGFNYVMTVDKNNIIRVNKINIGGRSGEDVEVLTGLEKTDRFVLSGGSFLNEGDHVNVVEDPTANAKWNKDKK